MHMTVCVAYGCGMHDIETFHVSFLLPYSQNEDWDRIFGGPSSRLLPSRELSGSSSKGKKPPNSPGETRRRGEVVSEPLPPPTSPSKSQGEQFGFGEKSLARVEERGARKEDCKLISDSFLV